MFIVYLDDIESEHAEHNKRIWKVFTRLRAHNLKLQPIKCEFLRREIIYLGHKLTEKWVLPPDERQY